MNQYRLYHSSACLRWAAVIARLGTSRVLCVPPINQCRMMVTMGDASILNHDMTSPQRHRTAQHSTAQLLVSGRVHLSYASGNKVRSMDYPHRACSPCWPHNV